MTSRAPTPSTLPALYGVIHLRALPGSPNYAGDLSAIASACARDANALADAGFEAVIVENYGDVPFTPGKVSPVTVAAMTRCCLAARVAAPTLALGINVLRNDAEAALAVAVAVGAAFLMTWANLAVGIIGNEGNPAHLMFFGVVAIGLCGAAVARS